MKTYAIAQMCDKHGRNRLIDRISGNAQSIIDWYKKAFRCDEVLLFKQESYSDDPDPLPENLLFFEPNLLIPKDIEWLRKHQERYGMPFIDSVQLDMNSGYLGFFRGICVSVVRDTVYVNHTFLIELRHIYDI